MYTVVVYDHYTIYYESVLNLIHREDGPAVVWNNGDEEWYLNGTRHNLFGPAIKIAERYFWYINGHEVTIKISKWTKERGIDLYNLTEEDKAVIFVEWGNYEK